MSETKRVELTTVSVSQKRKKAARKQVTYRFHVTLGESNIETCPEYSFTDFMRNDKPSNGDPFDDSDEEKEVTAIAQRFEAKYGPKGLQSGKKTRTQEMDDYYDPGDGYDEDDPFIDNTEAYDEVVPSSMTTLHGGFYINQGKLSLKNLNDDLNDFVQVKKRKKSRPLDSENEEETGASLAKKFKSMKRKKQAENREGDIKKVSFSKEENGEGNIKKKIKLKLKKMKPDAASQKDRISPSLAEPVQIVPVTDSVTASSQSKATLAAATAATTNGTTEARTDTSGKDELGTLEDVFSAVLRDSLNEDSSSKSGEEGKGENQTAERNTQLPPQLPLDLLEAIENMKKEAKESKEKKLKFFTDHINKLLLDIEIGSHKLPWGSKTAIYNHLGEHLPCGKHTLQRRAKKLRESQEEDQLKEPIHKLREAIMKVMPGLMEQHDLDVQKAKLDAETKEEVGDAAKEEMSTESEGEVKSDNQKKPKGPRRKFLWNSELRDLLMSIVATKLKHYSTSKSRNQTAEDYLKAYLDSEIKSIWPQGWMQTRMLFKESKKVHEDVTRGTLPHNRQKKAVTAHEATPSIPEIPRVHVSKVEDVIEVSSVMETSNESKDTIVVNLPNSVPSSEVYPTPVPSLMPLPVALINKPSFKTNATTGQSNQNLSSVSLSASQKGLESAASLPAKYANTDSVSSVPKVLSAERSVPTKSLASMIYPVTTAGSRVTGSSSIAATKSQLNNSNRSFLEVFDGFLNSRSGKPDISSASSDQQSSSQKQTFSILQHKAVSQQQQQQPKSPQGAQNVANSELYKAASKPRLVNESIDIPNLLRTNFPVMLSSKSNNSTTSASHNLETRNTVEGMKNPHTSVQQNQILSYQSPQPMRKHNNFVPKPHELVGQKKQQLIAESDFPRISVADSGNQFANQTGITSVDFNASSSEQKLKNRGKEHSQDAQNMSNQPTSKLKSGQVMDISTSAQKMNVKNPVIRTGTVLSTGTLPQLTARAASDFTGWKSARGPEGVNVRQPLLQGNVVSSTNNIVRPLTLPSPSLPPPPLSSKLPAPLTSSTTAQVGAPQSCNQSSPKSSEENSVCSAYEQIKSQMRQQEEIEGQALKNLAMALHMGGKSSSKLFEGPS